MQDSYHLTATSCKTITLSPPPLPRAVAIGTAATAMAVPVFGLTFTIESRLCSARDQINSAMPVP